MALSKTQIVLGCIGLLLLMLSLSGVHGTSPNSVKANRRVISQAAILQLKASAGAKSIAQLVREQEAGIIEPGEGQVCAISITNSFGGSPVIIAAPPGQATEFEFQIGPGGFFNGPKTDGPSSTLEQILVKTDKITKAFFVWEFCR